MLESHRKFCVCREHCANRAGACAADPIGVTDHQPCVLCLEVMHQCGCLSFNVRFIPICESGRRPVSGIGAARHEVESSMPLNPKESARSAFLTRGAPGFEERAAVSEARACALSSAVGQLLL